MNQSPLLIAENLTGGYQARSIIHQLNLQLERGEWFGFDRSIHLKQSLVCGIDRVIISGELN